MRTIWLAALLAAATALSGCGSKFLRYEGPAVTRVLVYKGSRTMYLMHGDAVLKAYPIELGQAPVGHKAVQGDGRTPEGDYLIDRRNPDSQFHLSVGIDYPRPADVEVARGMGLSPGGDIFIHGTPRDKRGKADWTWGCIAVENDHIEEVYAMVRDGTPITILP